MNIDTNSSKMKIRYKRKRNIFYLIMIVFWGTLIISSFIFSDFTGWSDYSVVALGAMYITIYSSNYIKQYLTVENGTVRNNSIFSKKVILSEVKVFKKFAGEYILQTDSKELRIDTNIIEDTSLVELDKRLADLNLSNP